MDGVDIVPSAGCHGAAFRPTEMIGKRRKTAAQAVDANLRQASRAAYIIYMPAKCVRVHLDEGAVGISGVCGNKLGKARNENFYIAPRSLILVCALFNKRTVNIKNFAATYMNSAAGDFIRGYCEQLGQTKAMQRKQSSDFAILSAHGVKKRLYLNIVQPWQLVTHNLSKGDIGRLNAACGYGRTDKPPRIFKSFRTACFRFGIYGSLPINFADIFIHDGFEPVSAKRDIALDGRRRKNIIALGDVLIDSIGERDAFLLTLRSDKTGANSFSLC